MLISGHIFLIGERIVTAANLIEVYTVYPTNISCLHAKNKFISINVKLIGE